MAFLFPWSNFHELNLDWILSVVKEAKEIFVRGEGDIQHAVETADQALETAEQAAAGVIADGAVTIPKVNDEVFNLMAYIVSGSVNAVAIPAGSLVILRKSTVAGVNDGMYVAAADIPASSVLTAADLLQPSPLPDAGGLNYVLSQITDTETSINAIERGLAIVVDGNNASSAVPVGALAYLKNNENGLQEGLYANVSNTPYPTTGGTADANVFTAVPNVLNSLKQDLSTVETIAGDGVLTDFTASDLTGAANELKGEQAQLRDDVDALENDVDGLEDSKADEESIALRRTGTVNTGSQIDKGRYFYLDGTLKRAIAIIAQNASFTAQNCETVLNGGLNALIPALSYTQQGLNAVNCTIINGGYAKFGNIVIVNIRFTITAVAPHVDGFPLPISANGNYIGSPAYDGATDNVAYCYLNQSGNLTVPANYGSSGSLLISLVYLAQ